MKIHNSVVIVAIESRKYVIQYKTVCEKEKYRKGGWDNFPWIRLEFLFYRIN